jgi:hypothetical protein
MDFVRGLPKTRKGHNYLFVVVDSFKIMWIMMPSQNSIKGQEEASKFFEQV